MDDKMIRNALELLSYCPLIFLVNGFWMLSNRQMFESVVNEIQLSTQQMSSDHCLTDIFRLTPTTPMLVLVFCLFNIIIMRRCCESRMKAWGFVISTNELNVDENLPNFFDAIKLSDAQDFVTESRYYRKNY